jgi:hypothetical protein
MFQASSGCACTPQQAGKGACSQCRTQQHHQWRLRQQQRLARNIRGLSMVYFQCTQRLAPVMSADPGTEPSAKEFEVSGCLLLPGH